MAARAARDRTSARSVGLPHVAHRFHGVRTRQSSRHVKLARESRCQTRRPSVGHRDHGLRDGSLLSSPEPPGRRRRSFYSFHFSRHLVSTSSPCSNVKTVLAEWRAARGPAFAVAAGRGRPGPAARSGEMLRGAARTAAFYPPCPEPRRRLWPHARPRSARSPPFRARGFGRFPPSAPWMTISLSFNGRPPRFRISPKRTIRMVPECPGASRRRRSLSRDPVTLVCGP